MKAVLVIDMPDGIDADEVLVDYCLHTKGEYKTIRKSGNHPLKPMPLEMRTSNLSEKEQEKTELLVKMAVLKIFADGWNECIKEIEK